MLDFERGDETDGTVRACAGQDRAEQQDLTPSPVFTENIYIVAAHDYGGHRWNCALRRMFTRHSGGRVGWGKNFFCVWIFVHCQRINKKKWRSRVSFTNTTWGRELRCGLQLWLFSAKCFLKPYLIWAARWCSEPRRLSFRFGAWDISVWSSHLLPVSVWVLQLPPAWWGELESLNWP